MIRDNPPNQIFLNQNLTQRSANSRPFLFLFAAMFIGLPLFFMGAGISMLIKQETKINTYIKTEAHVESSAVDQHYNRSSKRSRWVYKPLVRYDYDENGQHYQSSQTLMEARSSSDQSWAQRIADKFHPGDVCPAYYNPYCPQDAYLVREHNFFPYFFIIFPMLHLTVGLIVLLLALGFFGASQAKLSPLPGGWSSVYPDYSLANRRLAAVLFSGLWLGVGMVVLGHYFFVSENPLNAWATITTAIYVPIGLVGLVPAIRWSMVLNEMSEPKVKIKADSVKRGEIIPVEVELRTRNELKIKEIQIGVQCHDTNPSSSGKGTTTSLVYEKWETIPENRSLRADQKLTVGGDILVPLNEPALVSFSFDAPSVKWSIGVRVRVENGTDYSGKFPIPV